MNGRGKRRALDSSNRQAVTTALADLLSPWSRDAEFASINRHENLSAGRYGRRRQQTLPLIGSLAQSRLAWHQRDALCVRWCLSTLCGDATPK